MTRRAIAGLGRCASYRELRLSPSRDAPASADRHVYRSIVTARHKPCNQADGRDWICGLERWLLLGG